MLYKTIKLKCPADNSQIISVVLTVCRAVQSLGLIVRLHVHIPHHSTQCGIYTVWDAYLRQEQLTQKEMTLSLTHRGQVNHSLTELSTSCPVFH